MIEHSYFQFLNESVEGLPFQITLNQGSSAFISSSENLLWKGKAFQVDHLRPFFDEKDPVKFHSNGIEVSLKLKSDRFFLFLGRFRQAFGKLAEENLSLLSYWGTGDEVSPSGFRDSEGAGISKEVLEHLYEDNFIVREKKPFVIDLNKSFGSYMVSAGNERKTIIDAAAQIASLTTGFNHPMTQAMCLRPEMLDPNLKLEDWDIYIAYRNHLRRKSGQPNFYAVNSGAEAIETALKACQTQYPDRRKVIAFEGSFHGRTLLALHTTYNPAKRTPFEIYKDLVSFISFPEDKNPYVKKSEPKGWLEAWATAGSNEIEARLASLRSEDDPVFKSEIDSLLKIRKEIIKERPLAVVVEPMQCEGGDRYGTSRFFRALRVLTRVLDTPLIFDEVQTGFGLGGTFFWHQQFRLEKLDGTRDYPDAVCLAKKAQVGVCLTRFELKKHKVETSAASIYRGFLSAIAVLDFDFKRLESRVKTYLSSFQETLGGDLVQNPRNKGLCFAFDVPNTETMNALVSKRFENGILFYPAGEKTLRFRLMTVTGERELAQIFISLFRCFKSLEKENKIRSIPDLGQWIATLPSNFSTIASEEPRLAFKLPWKEEWIPKSEDDFKGVDRDTWIRIFSCVAKAQPQLLRSPYNKEFSLEKLTEISGEQLWKKYIKDTNFSLLDLLWQSSRAFGFSIHRINAKEVESYLNQIDQLEKETYEPARQADMKLVLKISEDPKCIFLASFDEKQLAGICIAAPTSYFDDVPMFEKIPHFLGKKSLYSMDLTVHKDFQGKGLGFRFKCEQYIGAQSQGSTYLFSRNRYPEALPMVHLNRRLAAVSVFRNDRDYGGTGTAFYQSVTIEKLGNELTPSSPYLPAIRNKTSLANFISEGYVRNLLLLKELLPENLKHIYLASSRAESVDKLVKLMKSKRPEADYVISFEGDSFGETTACARSLGSKAGQFFKWPVLPLPTGKTKQKQIDELNVSLEQLDLKKCLGVFVETVNENGQKKSESLLKSIVEVCNNAGVPCVFNETHSAFFSTSKKKFLFSSGEVSPDGVYFYVAGQLGVIAVSEKLFLDVPLMLISTWDGDETSLNMMRERIIRGLVEEQVK